ncbi:hypothetical protein GGE12_005539 [Rhizobium mongolense]|uniref:Uncharacterized protein n=1 Tax=Rhizobium mongolense TaxID=57676 RepID=A0A7W6WH84_9HYPH|nr:hypothetical protein [Rhizobium mongolense]
MVDGEDMGDGGHQAASAQRIATGVRFHGQPRTRRSTVEEEDIKFVFKLADAFAYGGLADVQFVTSGAEAAISCSGATRFRLAIHGTSP